MYDHILAYFKHFARIIMHIIVCYDKGTFGLIPSFRQLLYDLILHSSILEAYGCHVNTLNFVHNRLSSRKLRIQVNKVHFINFLGGTYSAVSRKELYLALWLLNIYLCVPLCSILLFGRHSHSKLYGYNKEV